MDPCKNCADYPYQCRGICKDKMLHINEVNEETPIVKKEVYKPKRVFDNSVTKNGIRRDCRECKSKRTKQIC